MNFNQKTIADYHSNTFHKNALAELRAIFDNPESIADEVVLSLSTRLYLDYLVDSSSIPGSDILNHTFEDLMNFGVMSATDYLLNPYNDYITIEKSQKFTTETKIIKEEKKIFSLIANTLANLVDLDNQAKENEKLYLESPQKIKDVFKELGITDTLMLDKISETFMVILYEARSFKVDHSLAFIAIDEHKKSGRSLSREERITLGIDEVIKERDKIKADYLKLLEIIKALLLKAAAPSARRSECFEKLKGILNFTLEELPKVDYINLNEYFKYTKNKQKYLIERTRLLLAHKSSNMRDFNLRVKSIIKLIANELLTDAQTGKIKLDSSVINKPAEQIITKEILNDLLSRNDLYFYNKFILNVRSECDVVFFQNPGVSYYNEALNAVVIHNYLNGDFSAQKESFLQIGSAFAQVLVKYDVALVARYISFYKADKKNVLTQKELSIQFIIAYSECFCQRVMSIDNCDWQEFVNSKSKYRFFRENYFKALNKG